MRRASLLTCFVLSIVGVAAHGAPPRASAPLEALAAQLGKVGAEARAALGCTGPWAESTGRMPSGDEYTTATCTAPEQQYMVRAGRVFALGKRLKDGLAPKKGKDAAREVEAELLRGGCRRLAERPQLVAARCAGDVAAFVLENWDSRTNTSQVSLLVGQASVLLPMFGLTDAPR